MIFHANHGDEANPGNIVICANDTDILVILLENAKRFNSHIWYGCGLDSINTRCYVDITILAKTINYVDVLLGIYAYTSCDYTPAFYQKGKVRPLALMMKNIMIMKNTPKIFRCIFVSWGCIIGRIMH